MMYLTFKNIQELALARPIFQVAMQATVEQVVLLALSLCGMQSWPWITLGSSITLTFCALLTASWGHILALKARTSAPHSRTTTEGEGDSTLLDSFNLGLVVLKNGRVKSADSRSYRLLGLVDHDQEALMTALE